MSDGTPTLRFLDPSTFTVTRRVTVRDGASAGRRSERARGHRRAGLRQRVADRSHRDHRARRRPRGGLAGSVEADARLGSRRRGAERHRLRCAGDRLFVTGKLWPRSSRIKVRPPREGQGRAVRDARAREDQSRPARAGHAGPTAFTSCARCSRRSASTTPSSAWRARARSRSNATSPACRWTAPTWSGVPPRRCGDPLRRTGPAARRADPVDQAHSAAGRARRRQRRRRGHAARPGQAVEAAGAAVAADRRGGHARARTCRSSCRAARPWAWAAATRCIRWPTCRGTGSCCWCPGSASRRPTPTAGTTTSASVGRGRDAARSPVRARPVAVPGRPDDQRPGGADCAPPSGDRPDAGGAAAGRGAGRRHDGQRIRPCSGCSSAGAMHRGRGAAVRAGPGGCF